MNIYYFSTTYNNRTFICQVDAKDKDMALKIAQIMFIDRFGINVDIKDIKTDDVDITSHKN